MNLEQEARAHFRMIEDSIAYHRSKLEKETRDGVKHITQKHIAALEFLLEYAKEALTQRGIKV